MKRFYFFLKFCFYLFILCTVVGLGATIYLFNHFSKDLPKLDSLKDYNPPVVSNVYADDGTKVGEFWIERRIVLSQQEIPKLVEQAIISSEDQSFFEHSGIDYMGIVRAAIENFRAGAIVQGGSTITQQVVKSFLLTNERSYERKIKEAILAKKLEENFTKQDILYLYLNQIYLGNRAYGIESAAQNYFHKTAKEMNIAEAAMIAGLAKAPSSFSPIKNFPRAKERQEYVIDRMFDEGYITNEQLKQAKAFKLKIYQAGTDKQYNYRFAPWYVEEVRRQIIEKYGENVPYTHGLQIYTSLDMKAQKAADNAVSRGLTELHKRHGYGGPKKNLPQTEWDAFFYEVHREMFFDTMIPGTIIPGLTRDDVNQTKVSLDSNKIYEAIVTEVDAKTRTITARAGNITGKILPRDFGWARKRNNASSGYDGVMYIQTPVNLVKVGDVIEVKLVDVTKLDEKTAKNYPADVIHFSLEETPLVESALFAYDVPSGHVRAIVGGKNFIESEFNRATQAVRQTGSVFKPLLYASAVDKGYKQETVIQDAPLRIPDGPGRWWTPQNYGGGYKGPMTMRSALIASRNVVSVRIILDVGVEYATAMIRKLGITTPIAKVYSMSLGANDMKVMEISRAFGVFPTGGILPDLIFIKKMTDRFGTVMEQNEPKKIKNFKDQIKDGDLTTKIKITSLETTDTANLRKDLWADAQRWIKEDKLTLTPYEEIILYGNYIPEGYAINPKTAYTMVDIMKAIVTSGTGYKVHSLGRPAAGKTGTTNDLTDTWFVGYTPDHVAGVWVGYDQPNIKVGGGETGGKAAAPIFLYYMQEFLEGKPIAEFDKEIPEMYVDLEPPVKTSPGEVSDLFNSGGGGGGGGADFFADDI